MIDFLGLKKRVENIKAKRKASDFELRKADRAEAMLERRRRAREAQTEDRQRLEKSHTYAAFEDVRSLHRDLMND